MYARQYKRKRLGVTIMLQIMQSNYSWNLLQWNVPSVQAMCYVFEPNISLSKIGGKNVY